MMDWLGKMLSLPEEFLFSSGGDGGGVIQGTASEATLVTMLAARSQALTKLNSSSQESTKSLDKLVAYCSTQSHSSVERASLLAAVTIRGLEPDEDLSLRGSTLLEAIKSDRAKGLIPFYVVATLGTTNSCAFDNITEIGKICEYKTLSLSSSSSSSQHHFRFHDNIFSLYLFLSFYFTLSRITLI